MTNKNDPVSLEDNTSQESWVCTLADGFRLVIPEQLRERLGNRIVVTNGLTSKALLFSSSGWEVFSDNLMKKNVESWKHSVLGESIAPTKSILLQRIIAPAQECSLDSQGGLELPELVKINLLKDSINFLGSTSAEQQVPENMRLRLTWTNDHVCMDPEYSKLESFGCSHCWVEDPQETRMKLVEIKDVDNLVNEEHYQVKLIHCPQCDQNFVYVYTETIDWASGNDPSYVTVVPLLEEEAKYILVHRERLTEDTINALGPDRKTLRRDFPSWADSPTVYWGQGITIGPHD